MATVSNPLLSWIPSSQSGILLSLGGHNPITHNPYVHMSDQPPTYDQAESSSPPQSTQHLSPVTTTASIIQDESVPEELPDYAPTNLPTYEAPPSTSPIATFTLNASDRKLRTLIPSPSTPGWPSYHITARAAPKVLSKKPDLTLTRVVDTTPRNLSIGSNLSALSTTSSIHRTPPQKRTMAASVAQLYFTTRTSHFPWMPRCRMTHVRNPLVSPRTYILCAPNFCDFEVSIGGEEFVWKVTDHPSTSLILCHRSPGFEGDRIVARFSYSEHGTTARRGEDIGTLDVYEVPVPIVSALSEEGAEGVADELEWIELVISGLELVVQHWRNLGKHFRSGLRPYRCKIGGLEEIIISRPDRRRRRAGL